MKQITIIGLLSLILSVFTNTQTKLSAEILKKIEDNTPKALPQTPAVPKLKSDAQDDNLRGKVKTVIEELENLEGVYKKVGRRCSSIINFNKEGNYLREVDFSYTGELQFIEVYGYIDGARVSVSNFINSANTLRTTGAVNSNSEEEKVNDKPDTRYEHKYEYKYINGKLAEMQIFYNTGKKRNALCL